MSKTVRLTYVNKLFRQINKALATSSSNVAVRDGGRAVREAYSLMVYLMKTSKDVLNKWERGDLANATNWMRDALETAEGR